VDGLVGRILETGASASRVLLLTDADSTVPVRLVRNGLPALVRGRGDSTVSVTALLPGSRPFRRGDVVKTSGTGGIYPPGIPVAVVVLVDGDTAVGWPLAHPETLDFAMVLRPYLAQPARPVSAPPPPGP
jgi:rod shape-determining protein MreC